MFNPIILTNILASTVRISTPLLLGALGELVAETAGVMNLGLEGTMLMAAFASFLVAYFSGSWVLGLVAAIAAGMAMSLVVAFLSITLKVNQIVTGMTLNILASGVTLFGYNVLVKQQSELPTIELLNVVPIPGLASIPFVGEVLFQQRALTYFALGMVPVIWVLLFRTRFGLQLRSVGENPRAVDMRGMNVDALQYAAVLFGGAMAGLAGAFITLGASTRFVPDMTAGRGWLAIVIVIAGSWQPWRTLWATLIFAFLDAFQLQLQGVGVQLPYQLLLALPYGLALVVLMSCRMKSPVPKWLGVPYIRGDR